MPKKAIKLALVLPCYNEEQVLPTTFTQLIALFDSLINEKIIAADSFIYCVDDGSSDNTWTLIREDTSNYIKGMRLMYNVGQQNAYLAGLREVDDKVDCVITLDADLQDDVNTIRTMLEEFQKGFDIVYGVRQSRKNDPFSKRFLANFYYRFQKKLGIKIWHNHADFRLMSQRVLKSLSLFPEHLLIMRSLLPSLGFKHSVVYYDRQSRIAGTPKYNFRKSLSLAWLGISTVSTSPLRLVSVMGFFLLCLSLILSFTVGVMYWYGHVISLWYKFIIPILFLSALQLFSTGLIGGYLANIYQEVKGRPRYIKAEER